LISFSYSLVILGNYTEFERAVLWLSENLTFDVDARVNLFEVLICYSSRKYLDFFSLKVS
jgi:mannosidase alpha-like ER degradation enhancer 1